MANAQDRISALPSLILGTTLSGGAWVPISQFEYTTTGTLTTFKVPANQIAAVALSGISSPGFVVFRNPGYASVTLTGGTTIYVNGGDGSTNATINHASSTVLPGTYGSAGNMPVLTVDQQGHLTSASTISISNGGTLTDISITGTTNQIAVASTFNPSFTSGSYTISLPALVVLTGKTLSGGTLSGPTINGATITGSTLNNSAIGASLSSTVSATTAQVLTLKFSDGSSMTTAASGGVAFVGTQSGLTGGPVTTSGTIGMAVAGVTAATYGSATLIPVLTIDAFGRTTSATTAAVSTSTDVLQVQVFT